MIELIYTSVTPQTLDTAIVSDILATSKRNNDQKGITGHLFYDGRRFLQILEGEHEALYSLFDAIESDPRHEDVELLYEQEIETRSFPDWQMAYEPLVAHSLHNPMQNIVSVHEGEKINYANDTILNYGVALFRLFRESMVKP